MRWVSNKTCTKMEPRFSFIHTIILAFCFKFRDHFLGTAFGNDTTNLQIRKRTRRRKSRKPKATAFRFIYITIHGRLSHQTTFTQATIHNFSFIPDTFHTTHPATPYNFYNKQIFQEPFAPETFCTVDTKHFLHQAPCPPSTSVTLEHFLHHTSFTTDNFTRTFVEPCSIHTKTITTDNFTPLYQALFTPDTFCTKQFLHLTPFTSVAANKKPFAPSKI